MSNLGLVNLNDDRSHIVTYNLLDVNEVEGIIVIHDNITDLNKINDSRVMYVTRNEFIQNNRQDEFDINWEIIDGYRTNIVDDVTVLRCIDSEHERQDADIYLTTDRMLGMGNSYSNYVVYNSPLGYWEILLNEPISEKDQRVIDAYPEVHKLLFKIIYDIDESMNINCVIQTDDIVRTSSDMLYHEMSKKYVSFSTVFRHVIIKEQSTQLNRLLCYAPWTNASMQGGDRTMYCCSEATTDYNTTYDNWDEYWNSDRIVNMRRGLLSNSPSSDCKHCLSQDNNNTNVRDYADYLYVSNPKLFTHLPLITKTTPLHIIIIPSNNCNLSCKICGSDYSNTYDKYAYKSGLHESKKGTVTIESKHYKMLHHIAPGLVSINILGGDLMFDSANTKMLLQSFEGHEDHIEIFVNTNGMLLDIDIVNQLSKFKKVMYVFSIDGDAESCSKSRLLSNRSKIIKNVLALNEMVNDNDAFTLGVHMAISNLNVFSLPKFSDELFHDFNNVFTFIDAELVSRPYHYATYNVEDKSSAIEYIKTQKQYINDNLIQSVHDRLCCITDEIIALLYKYEDVDTSDIFKKFNHYESKWGSVIKVKNI